MASESSPEMPIEPVSPWRALALASAGIVCMFLAVVIPSALAIRLLNTFHRVNVPRTEVSARESALVSLVASIAVCACELLAVRMTRRARHMLEAVAMTAHEEPGCFLTETYLCVSLVGAIEPVVIFVYGVFALVSIYWLVTGTGP